MSINCQRPDPLLHNHIRYRHAEFTAEHSRETTFSAQFGDVYSVTPISILGPGHFAHVEIRFTHGLRLDLSPEVVVELARRFPEALAKLPFIPELNDAVIVGDE